MVRESVQEIHIKTMVGRRKLKQADAGRHAAGSRVFGNAPLTRISQGYVGRRRRE